MKLPRIYGLLLALAVTFELLLFLLRWRGYPSPPALWALPAALCLTTLAGVGWIMSGFYLSPLPRRVLRGGIALLVAATLLVVWQRLARAQDVGRHPLAPVREGPFSALDNGPSAVTTGGGDLTGTYPTPTLTTTGVTSAGSWLTEEDWLGLARPLAQSCASGDRQDCSTLGYGLSLIVALGTPNSGIMRTPPWLASTQPRDDNLIIAMVAVFCSLGCFVTAWFIMRWWRARPLR